MANSEKNPKTRKRSTKKYQTYKRKKNSVNITVYDPHGETIPAHVRHKVEQAVLDLALENKLLITVIVE